LTAGFCEAVKQAAISGDKLFSLTNGFLKKYSLDKFNKIFSDKDFINELENLLKNQVAFKAEIVEQDERENSDRADGKSRKILNFGHTLAHALEKVTEYKRFKHGEAVGYGILFAAELSKRLDILDNNELILLKDVLRNVGKLPEARNINLEKVFAAFKFDKKQTGNSLQWILLESIGKPKIVSGQDIPDTFIQQTLKKFYILDFRSENGFVREVINNECSIKKSRFGTRRREREIINRGDDFIFNRKRRIQLHSVAYEAQDFKQEMQTAVVQGTGSSDRRRKTSRGHQSQNY
jgi:hypothetical protein